MRTLFGSIARWITEELGSPYVFVIATVSVVAWVLAAPVEGIRSPGQLLMQTWPTIVTFLMVFVIRNAENRHTRAIQIKLDELLRAVSGARTGLMEVEMLSDEELRVLQKRLMNVGKQYAEQTAMTEDELSDLINDAIGDAAEPAAGPSAPTPDEVVRSRGHGRGHDGSAVLPAH